MLISQVGITVHEITLADFRNIVLPICPHMAHNQVVLKATGYCQYKHQEVHGKAKKPYLNHYRNGSSVSSCS